MAYHQQSQTHRNPHSDLEFCVKDILSLINPTEDDVVKRRNAINELATVIRSEKSLNGASIKPFGSFVSNLYTKWGDLDIFIDLTHSTAHAANRKGQLNVLRKILLVLKRTGVAYNIEFISNARVPLVAYRSNFYNISCDISVNNHAGHIKSIILQCISSIDARFREFVLLIKEWAIAHHIKDPKRGTLNSYSLCLLVIFHFQTCNPAILPPLKDLYQGNIVDDIKGHITEKHIRDVFAANMARYKSQLSSHRNQSSLCHLLVSFFDKFSRLDAVASDYVICTFTGLWEKISSNDRWMEKKHHLFIEDPFEQSENAARAVGLRGLSEISQAIMDTYMKFSSHLILMDRTALYSTLVGPGFRSKLSIEVRPLHVQFRQNFERSKQAHSGYLNDASLDEHHHQPPSTSMNMGRQVGMQRQMQQLWMQRNPQR